MTAPAPPTRDEALSAPLDRLPILGGTSIHALGMDTTYPERSVSLVVASGMTVVELGYGPLALPLGDRATLVESLARDVEERRDRFRPAPDPGMPARGRVSLWLRGEAGIAVAEASEIELVTGSHPLADVYAQALHLVAAVLEDRRRAPRDETPGSPESSVDGPPGRPGEPSA